MEFLPEQNVFLCSSLTSMCEHLKGIIAMMKVIGALRKLSFSVLYSPTEYNDAVTNLTWHIQELSEILRC